MTALVAHAREVIQKALQRAQHPRVLCSFGKDSLVLLDLLAEFGVRAVLHAQGPDEQVDPDYVAALTMRYDLDVTLLPKGRGHLFFLGTHPFFLSFPFINPTVMLPFPLTMTPYCGEPTFTCIDEELRASAGGVLSLETDCIFSGQKASDLDHTTCAIVQRYLPRADRQLLRKELRSEEELWWGTLPVAAPLQHWTDDDVWSYIEQHHLPTSPKMYHRHHRLHQEAVTCYRCHDPNGPGIVDCPRWKRPLTNLRHFTKETGLSQLATLGVITTSQAAELERRYA